jgi:hypothetical protein
MQPRILHFIHYTSMVRTESTAENKWPRPAHGQQLIYKRSRILYVRRLRTLLYSSVQWIDTERGNAAITAAGGAQTMAGPPPLTRLVGRQQGRKLPESSGKRGK